MIVQTTMPVIKFYNKNGNNYKNNYYIFSPEYNSNYPSGQNLQNYTFSRSKGAFSGQFSITLREDSRLEKSGFMDLVDNLHIVEIYENGEQKPQFIGVVTAISYSATASGLQKMITISGSGIEYLFEYLTISLDATAMAYIGEYVNADKQNIMNKLTLNKEGVKVSQMFTEVFNAFKSVCITADNLSNSDILKMIENWYGTNPASYLQLDNDFQFSLPIASNLYSNSTISLPPYLRNLLPENVYEMYGIIEDGKPKIRIRELPFSTKEWNNIKKVDIPGKLLTQYTFSRSIGEVYTVFYSYVEGSVLSSDFYVRANSSTVGYETAAKDINKIKKFGYKPLICNFVGFNTTLAGDNSTNDKLKKEFTKLNEKMKNWYGKLDEMYDGNIKIVNTHYIDGKENINASIGERIGLLGGDFYVSGINNSWSYGRSPEITYTAERGGIYDSSGNFSKLKNITKQLAELGE